MPLISACQLPPPANWQDFESLCLDLWREEWDCKNIQKVGRLGQSQDGVDICGQLKDRSWAGIQCKCIRIDSVLSEQELLSEVAKARHFEPKLAHYVLATTGLKDASLEKASRRISTENRAVGAFTVSVFSWTDICLLLERHSTVATRHFPFVIRSVLPVVINNRSTNLQPATDRVPYSFFQEEFVHPRIVEELVGWISDSHGTVVSIDVSSANKSNRFYGEVRVIRESSAPWVEHEYDKGSPLGRKPYFRYKHLGTSCSGVHILHTMWGGGGTGHFNNLCLVTFEIDSGLSHEHGTLKNRERILLKTFGTISIGDRYYGLIELKGNVLTVGKDENSFGSLQQGFSIRVD
jgi:hypothetical protein